MKRTKLAMRTLPRYTRGEEIMNMVTHIVGGALGIAALILGVIKATGTAAVIGTVIFGVTMIALYTLSSTYHGMRPCIGKKVLQILDHCTIYFLIAGTYTPILLGGFLPVYPNICWWLLGFEWGLCLIAATLTAIDLDIFGVFSMICYIGMGWAIILFIPQCMTVMTAPGFYILLAGGLAYTVGAVLYGIGNKVPWMHSVFHIFVVAGSLLQFLAIYL